VKQFPFIIVLSLVSSIDVLSQEMISPDEKGLHFNGQLSGYSNFAPDNDLNFLAGGRYIPELRYTLALDTSSTLDFLGSANIFGSSAFHPFDSANNTGDISAYRVWARLTGEQYEIRLGLQKIDFGVATVLRPLQWFNQVDPRDPLGITNGVYGGLARYYFLNNANLWFWVLYGNKNTKGFELLPTNQSIPEIGGRAQLPIPKGEIGLTYHYRVADSQGIPEIPSYEKIPENRFGLDVKWDVTVGLWLEFSHITKSKNLGLLTNQTLINVGTDYTFGIGSGLNVVVEHLLGSYDEKAFQFQEVSNTTAITLAYPISFFDHLSVVSTYNWNSHTGSFFLNYEHQFKKFAGYIMPYYNPATPQGLIKRDIQYSTTGPGIRLMIVYNH
jgi:hypothetical protein